MSLLALPIAAPAGAHPPSKPDHGVNATTFQTLWSGDEDAIDFEVGPDDSAMDVLATGTDVPLDAPPLAVEQWNRGDHREFPETDTDRSVHPPDARLEDGRFIADAHASMFAIQPSTRALVSRTAQPLYVAPNGTVLATVDYRVTVPEETMVGSRHVSWRLVSARIDETRLLVDGETEATATGSHRPTFQFAALDAYDGNRHTLTVEADISVEVERIVSTRSRRCQTNETTNETACRSPSSSSSSLSTETVTASDSIEVEVYDLSISGFSARYPDGDLGIVVFKNAPWLGYSVPSGDVRGVWRFYSARDPTWDALVSSTENGSTTAHSPLHPLQVYAYPFEPGPTAVPSGAISFLEVYGTETDPPTLAEDVHLDVLTEPYVASFGLATRVRSTAATVDDVTAHGLVRGVTAAGEADRFVEIPLNQSELALTVVTVTDETVTVRAQLTDADTGEPINTVDRAGYVVLAGETVNTSGNGTVTRTLPRDVGGITARFEPSPWWHQAPSYVESSDVVYVRETAFDPLSIAFQLGVPVGLFLLGVFLIDRVTGWRIWPPWRGL